MEGWDGPAYPAPAFCDDWEGTTEYGDEGESADTYVQGADCSYWFIDGGG